MRLDLVVYDAHGKTRGYARLRLEFDSNLWFVEQDAQRAWRNAGFSQSGPFEAMDDDVIWLWEQELGNAKHNTVVLTDIPMDALEVEQAGSGRIVTGQIGKFHGGTVYWTVIEPKRPAGRIELMTGREPQVGAPMEMAA